MICIQIISLAGVWHGLWQAFGKLKLCAVYCVLKIVCSLACLLYVCMYAHSLLSW